MKRLAIVVTHPIQYYVPVFRRLAKQCTLKVYYTWGEGGFSEKYDPDFKRIVNWDLPLLDGYEYEFLKNTSKNPGSHYGKGIINPNIVQKIASFKPDAILIYGYIYDSHFKVMRQFKGKIPVWFRGDSNLLDKSSFLKKQLKFVYLKWVYKYIDKAFYVGQNNKDYFSQYGIKQKNLVLAPHAVDNERFGTVRQAETTQLRDSLGVKKDEILILFAGKLEPKKNPTLLLNAFLQVTDNLHQNSGELEDCKIHLLIVGNGILEENLKAESINYSNNIHFIDFQNQTQMPVFYQACDVFCLPSSGPGETWGLAVNEAMACGKAIIVSDKVGCAVDLVKHGINGYIFKSNDLFDLKQKLKTSKQKLKEMGLKSSEIIANWTLEHQVNAFIKSLYEIAD